MLNKQFERDDDKFIYQVENLEEHQTTIKKLTRLRSYNFIAATLTLLMGLVEIATQDRALAIHATPIFAAAFLYDDIRIKIMKLEVSKQQKSSDSNTPKTD